MIIHRGPIAEANIPLARDAFRAYGKIILTNVDGNSSLSTPYPGLAEFKADFAAFEAACAQKPVFPEDCDAKAVRIVRHIGHVVDHVQAAAEAQPCEADAVALIVSTGLAVKKPRVRKLPAFAAKYTGVPGEVYLVALSVPGARVYYWELSVDEKEWQAVPETVAMRTTIKGLTPGQTYWFRFRVLTRKGKSQYLHQVSIIAH